MIIEAISEQIKSQLIQPQFKIIQKDGSFLRVLLIKKFLF